MLHNTTREQLLQSGQGYVALVLDALYFVGWRPYTSFSAADAIQALNSLGTPEKIIRIALKHAVFQPAGRRSAIYKLPTPTSVLVAAGGDESKRVCDDLPAEAYKSLKAYRQALHHSLVTRRPGRYLRHLLARRLGVCKTTTRNYDRTLHHEVKPSYDYFPLDDEAIEKLPIEKPTSKKYFLLVKHKNKPFFAPLLRQIAEFWRARGVEVQMMQQTGNLYSPSALAASYITGEFSNFISH